MHVRRPQIRLIPATPRDLPRVLGWLSQRAVRRGWGGVVPNARELREDLSLLNKAVYPFLICSGNSRPIGYVMVSDSKEYEKEYLQGVTPGGFNIDIFIAERGLRGRGIGTRVIHLARQQALQLAGLEQAPPAFYAWINERNQASRRAFVKAGYKLYTGPDAQSQRPDTLYWLEGMAYEK